jgi:hypothetical protein
LGIGFLFLVEQGVRRAGQREIATIAQALLGAGIVFGEESTETIELAFHGGAVFADPLVESAEAGLLDAARAHAAELFGVDETDFFEDLQVLCDSGEGDAEGLGQARNRSRSSDKAIEDGATGGIAEGVKEPVDIDWNRAIDRFVGVPCHSYSRLG